MAVTRYDVYLTGAKDTSPSAQMRIITAIASRYRVAAESVAAAFDGNPCRIAEKLPFREADAMVAALGALGAVARFGAAGASPDARPPSIVDVDHPEGAVAKDGRVTLKSADAHTPLVDITEPIEFAEPGPDGRTGVRGSDTMRCPIHGLVYDRRRASGCVRCLAPARAQARQVLGESNESGPSGRSFRERPAQRAFWGLAIALAVGFIPALFFGRAPGRREVMGLRAQQAQISLAPATKASLTRFDELDAAAGAAHRRGAGRTLLIWVVVAAAVGTAWTKLT